MVTTPEGTPVTVSTPSGEVRGRERDGIVRFAGVPYATAARFAPPVPTPPWDGVHDATTFGPISPQNTSVMDLIFGAEPEPQSEDCLFLNVWSPSIAPATPLPVMVWIHGGGFEIGSGSSPMYDGTHFAEHEVVLVSINYRLGALGFLELGHLDPAYEGSGNVGILDQIAALEWVRDNIAAFGGDPDRVTIFGESAGAMSVSLLLAAPSTHGLFHQAIAQSGAASAARTSAQARTDAEEFLSIAGLTSIDEVLAAPIGTLLAAHGAINASRMADPEAVIRSTGNPLAFLPFRPVADGVHLPADPLEAIARGAGAGVPLIVGTNLEEWKLFAMMSPPATDLDGLRSRLGLITEDVEGALAAYLAEHPGASPTELEVAAMTDVVFRVPAAQLADAQRGHASVRQYLFTWKSPAFGGAIGSAHAVEIPFVFDIVDDPRLAVFVGPEAPRRLADSMVSAWSAFARGELDAVGSIPTWPELGESGRPVLILDVEPTIEDNPEAGTLAYWQHAHTVFDD